MARAVLFRLARADASAATDLDEVEQIAAVNDCHIQRIDFFSNKRSALFSILFDRTTGEMIDAFLTDPDVEFAERDYLIGFP